MQRLSRLTAVAALAFAALLPPAAAAAELRALFSGWSYDFEGTVDDDGARYDINDDLELEPRRRRGFALEIDTPDGGWPDMTLGYTPISAEGEHSEEVTFPLPGTRTILTETDFGIHEVVVRWPLNSGGLRFSVGVAVQQLEGELTIDDSQEAEPRRQRYDETFPLLHAQLRMAGKAFGLSAVAQAVEYDGSRALELRALAEARFLAPLLVQAGWQEKRYEIDLSDYALDARVSGAVLRFGVLYR